MSNCVPCHDMFVLIFFKTMYNKKILRFGFWDIRIDNQGRNNCFQPRLVTLTSPMMILDIAKTSSNTCLFWCEQSEENQQTRLDTVRQFLNMCRHFFVSAVHPKCQCRITGDRCPWCESNEQERSPTRRTGEKENYFQGSPSFVCLLFFCLCLFVYLVWVSTVQVEVGNYTVQVLDQETLLTDLSK